MDEKKWLDVSLTLKSGMFHWPGDPPVLIERVHSMDKGDTANLSRIAMGVHSGTHIDAPVHFIKGGWGIDQIPLDALIGAARVIEIYDGMSIKAAELAGHRIAKGERILLKTANSRNGLLHRDSFTETFIYMEKAAAEFLVSSSIRILGVDYLSIGGYKKNGPDVHRLLLGAEIPVIEGIDLVGVSAGSYDMICLPMKILDADGAPARVLLKKST